MDILGSFSCSQMLIILFGINFLVSNIFTFSSQLWKPNISNKDDADKITLLHSHKLSTPFSLGSTANSSVNGNKKNDLKFLPCANACRSPDLKDVGSPFFTTLRQKIDM